ncbi:ABC transporter ATP-binding protein [Myxococcota bacterium]|nr:ABC transporter ATP-binding protein [Myxococcota bacterium]
MHTETPADGDIVVRLEKASRVYNPGENEVRAMDAIDLEIRRGEFTALVGPSGSGKSTLLHCLGCLDAPTSGRVTIAGQDVTQGLTAAQRGEIRNRSIGFIFQSFNLIPVLTAYENIEFALQINGTLNARQIRERVDEMLALLGLTTQRDRRPNQLSGGQQQRVAIGRALAKRPALILADEPTANLDRKTSEDIIALMRRMNEQLGATFVFSTHDEHLMGHARRIVRLTDGRIVGEEKRVPAPESGSHD